MLWFAISCGLFDRFRNGFVEEILFWFTYVDVTLDPTLFPRSTRISTPCWTVREDAARAGEGCDSTEGCAGVQLACAWVKVRIVVCRIDGIFRCERCE